MHLINFALYLNVSQETFWNGFQIMYKVCNCTRSSGMLRSIKGCCIFQVGLIILDVRRLWDWLAAGISTTTASTTTTTTSTQQTTGSTTSTVSAQTAQPKAAKSGNSLVISSIPPGTYTVSNATNPSQLKVYTVTGKGCLVGDRTQIGSPSKFLVSRQGLTFPIDWASLATIPAAAIPQC